MIADMFDKEKLDLDSLVPLYFQLQNFIINQINIGNLSEGDMLPTEINISEKLNISRPTVRQALSYLVNQGYLFRIKGKGSFVSIPKMAQESTRFIESYNDEMKKKGLIPKTKVLELIIVEADERVASKLQLKINEKVIKLSRLRFASSIHENNDITNDSKPILLTTVYVPLKLIPKLINYDFEVFSFYEVLDKNNLPVKKVIRELEAKCSSEEWSKLLHIPYGDAVHFISSVGFLINNIPIEFSESIYPGSRSKFLIEIKR